MSPVRIFPALIGLLLVGATNARCATNPSNETVTETETLTETPLKLDTRAQAAMISTMAVHGLRYVADARSAIHEKQYKMAQDNLMQAQSLFQMARNNLSTARIRDEIQIAKKHLDYEETAMVEPDLIPIYSSVALVTDEPTRSRWTAALDRLKSFLHLGKKAAAKAQLNQLEQGVILTEVSLPLKQTEDKVATAQKQLATKNYKAADATLADAEGNLRVAVTALVGAPETPAPKKAE